MTLGCAAPTATLAARSTLRMLAGAEGRRTHQFFVALHKAVGLIAAAARFQWVVHHSSTRKNLTASQLRRTPLFVLQVTSSVWPPLTWAAARPRTATKLHA
jgi:hypothetical protein